MQEPENLFYAQVMRFEAFQPPEFISGEFDYRAESDETLIKLLNSGNSTQQSDALGEIYNRYCKHVWRFIRSREDDEEEAKDIWGSVWRIAVEKLPEFEYRGTPVKSWLLKTADILLKERWRKQKERNQISFDDVYDRALEYVNRELELEENDSSEQSKNEVQSNIDIVIAKLRKNFKPDEQKIIDYFYFKGLDCRQIGKLLNKKPGTIRVMKKRILHKLHRYLEELSKESRS